MTVDCLRRRDASSRGKRLLKISTQSRGEKHPRELTRDASSHHHTSAHSRISQSPSHANHRVVCDAGFVSISIVPRDDGDIIYVLCQRNDATEGVHKWLARKVHSAYDRTRSNAR